MWTGWRGAGGAPGVKNEATAAETSPSIEAAARGWTIATAASSNPVAKTLICRLRFETRARIAANSHARPPTRILSPRRGHRPAEPRHVPRDAAAEGRRRGHRARKG